MNTMSLSSAGRGNGQQLPAHPSGVDDRQVVFARAVAPHPAADRDRDQTEGLPMT
jgi:hypothetical protein